MTFLMSMAARPLPPPRSLSAPAAETQMILLWGAIFLVALVIAARVGRRRGDPIPFFLVFGGAVSAFQEPIVDLLGNIWLRTDHPLFTTFGRPMPIWGVLGYGSFYGGLAFALYSGGLAGWSLGRIRRLMAVVILVNLVAEPLLVALHLYKYYGRQPFMFFGLPLHWIFINTAGIVVGAAVALRARAWLASTRGVAAVLVLPVTVAGASMVTGLPVFDALNAGPSFPAVALWICSAVTCIAGLLVIGAATAALAAPQPETPQ